MEDDRMPVRERVGYVVASKEKRDEAFRSCLIAGAKDRVCSNGFSPLSHSLRGIYIIGWISGKRVLRQYFL